MLSVPSDVTSMLVIERIQDLHRDAARGRLARKARSRRHVDGQPHGWRIRRAHAH